METTMRNQIPAVATFAVLVVAGCAKSASVEGEAASKLTLVKPGAVTLLRGGMSKADIRIARVALAGEVTIRFTHLPKGVNVVDEGSRIVGDQGSYTLKADADADLVENHAADVTASAGPGAIAVSQPISINVKEREQAR
jgi:hypothetical protein